MKLVIGGFAQGKLHYVLKKYGRENCIIWDGAISDQELSAGEANRKIVFNHFHHWVKERLSQGGCPREECQALLEKYPDCIIISDEIGNGIVPVDAAQREWREKTGRLLVELAGQAEEVERILCGISQKIK